MATPRSTRNSLFLGRWFEDEIIILCVRWYLDFKLSYRDLVRMMADRGIAVSHTTIMRWVLHYAPEFEKKWKRYARNVGLSWPGAEYLIFPREYLSEVPFSMAQLLPMVAVRI